MPARMKVTNIIRLGEWDQVRVNFALTGGNRILASDIFKSKVITAKFTETQINGRGPHLTSQEVYDRIVAGDQLTPLDKVGELDVEFILYRKSFSKVVGYTFVDSQTIWVNRKFFGGPKSIFSNLLHESSHQLGFLHQGRWASTVPYTLNRIAEECWDVLCQDVDRDYQVWWNS